MWTSDLSTYSLRVSVWDIGIRFDIMGTRWQIVSQLGHLNLWLDADAVRAACDAVKTLPVMHTNIIRERDNPPIELQLQYYTVFPGEPVLTPVPKLIKQRCEIVHQNRAA